MLLLPCLPEDSWSRPPLPTPLRASDVGAWQPPSNRTKSPRPSLGDSAEQGRALCANRQPIGRIFDIAAGHRRAVVYQQRRTHAKPRIRRVGVLRRQLRRAGKFFHRSPIHVHNLPETTRPAVARQENGGRYFQRQFQNGKAGKIDPKREVISARDSRRLETDRDGHRFRECDMPGLMLRVGSSIRAEAPNTNAPNEHVAPVCRLMHTMGHENDCQPRCGRV